MDLPVHIATGALVGNAVLYAETRCAPQRSARRHAFECGAAAVLLGVASHLFWDAVPHYDWLFYIEVFRPLPMYWLIPQAVAALPVLFSVFHVGRDRPWLTAAAVFGGVYPDIEKFLYFDVNWPRQLVIFQQHSCYLSPWSPWERDHKTFLIFAEILLLLALLAGNYWLGRQRRSRKRADWASPQPVARSRFSRYTFNGGR